MTGILIILAAFLKAFADAQAHHGFMIRRYSFWSVSDGAFLPFTKYRFNSWHVANSLMVACFITGMFAALFGWLVISKGWLDISVGALFFIPVFNTFYNKIFR